MRKKSLKSGSVLDKKKNGSSKVNRLKTEIGEYRTSEGETRATFIIDETLLNSLKAIAYWERKQIKAVLKEALSLFIGEKGEDYVENALTEQRNSKDNS